MNHEQGQTTQNAAMDKPEIVRWINTPFIKSFFILIFITLFLWQVTPERLFSNIEDFAAVHIILEVFAVIIACMIFAISWYSPNQSNITIAGATLFLGVALLDLFHLMAYVGMPDFGSENSPHKSILFWLAARYLSVLAIFLFVLKSDKDLTWLPKKSFFLTLTIAGTLIYSYFAAVHPTAFPLTFSQESGLTPFKITLEYGLIFIFIIFAALIYKRAKTTPSQNDNGLFAAVIILAASEFLFTLYASVSDFANFSGHIYKVLAYWVIFQTIFVSIIKSPYKKLQQSEYTLKRLANIVSQNRDEQLFNSVSDLLFDKTQAEYILIIGYDAKTRARPEVLNFCKDGVVQDKQRRSDFIDTVTRHKLDRRNIMYSQSPETPHRQLPFNTQFKSFISYPLVSENHGNVGSVILASTLGFSLQQRLKETLFIISTRLAHELEQSIIAENKQNEKIKLARKLEAAREEERKTIARDIHDDLGGSLAALKIDISLLSKRLKKTNVDENIMSKLNSMNKITDKSIKDMRNIINNLRLGILDDIGIIEAIEWTLKETEKRHHISISFLSDLLTPDIESGLEEAARTSLFRMINEAITNVVKHAQATRISVELLKEDNQIVTRIIDDGQGIKIDNSSKNSYGIIGMQERVDLLDGEIQFSSPASGGTQIDIIIPIFRENIS